MAKKTSPVLVTGCAGKVGSEVAKLLLEKGYEVIGIDNLSNSLSAEAMPKLDSKKYGKKFHFINGDIRDLSLFNMLAPVSHVFHCAALTSVEEVEKEPIASVYVNVNGMINVMEYCLRVDAIFVFSQQFEKKLSLLSIQNHFDDMLVDYYSQARKLEARVIYTEHNEAERMINDSL